MPRGEYPLRPREGEQEDRLQLALQTLEQGIDSILSSEGFARYLQFLARFHSYSSSNVALILMQRPNATHVAGYKKWQELGRQVRKGEKGIAILVSHKRHIIWEQGDVNDEQKDGGVTSERTVFTGVHSFGVGRVFDVSQTDGDPLPEPSRPEVVDGASDTGMRLYADLLDFLEVHGVTTAREETVPSNGYYQPLYETCRHWPAH